MSRRREAKPVDNGPGWLATYGDLVTLLLAFFVMLFAVADVESQKFKAFLSGLGHFKNTAAQPGIWPPGSDAQELQINAGIGPAQQTGTAMTQEQDAIDGVEDQLRKSFKEAGLGDLLSLRPDARGVAAVLATDEVLFPTGSTVMSEKGKAALNALTVILQTVDAEITVEGHTDDTPLNRGAYTNWNLSADRAIAVVNHLASLGIDPNRLTAAGHGEFRPRAEGSSPEARAKNRRVEVIVHMRASTSTESGEIDISPTPIDIRAGTARTATG